MDVIVYPSIDVSPLTNPGWWNNLVTFVFQGDMNLETFPQKAGAPSVGPPETSLVQLPTGMYLYQLDSCCNAHKTCEMSEGWKTTEE